MATGETILEFPMGGLAEDFSYQHQRPYTSPRLINVRPRGHTSGRKRGGSRPGLAKAFADQIPLSPLTPGQPIRLLDSLATYRADTSERIFDDFDTAGALAAPNWGAAAWAGAPGLPTAAGGLVSVTNTSKAAVLADQNPDPARRVRITLGGVKMASITQAVEYHVYAMLDGTDGPEAASISVSLVNNLVAYPGELVLTIEEYASGAFLGGTSLHWAYAAETNDLVVDISGGRVTAKWGAHEKLSGVSQFITTDRIGFALLHTGPTAGLCQCTSFALDYAVLGAVNRARSVIASAGGQLLCTNAANALVAATAGTGINLGSDRAIRSAERFGLSYIADFGDYRAEGTDGVVSDKGGGTVNDFDSASVSNWTTVASVGDWLWIYNAIAAAEDVYQITAVTSDYITIDTVLTADTGVSWRVIRGAKVFNPQPESGNQLLQWAPLVTAGSLPAGCPLIACWNDRIVMAGGPFLPYAIWFSRYGNPLDWDFDADDADPARAVYFGAETGSVIGEPITAIVGFSNDYLLIGTENQLFVLRGDPGLGGVFENLSRKVGIISGGAWCAGPEGQIFFLARGGLYQIAPGASSLPQAVSGRILPRRLQDIDTGLSSVQMAYDIKDRGIHIYVAQNAGGVGEHWWVDEDGGFFEVTLAASHQPTAIGLARDLGSGLSDVLVGCYDGYIRRFSDGASTDDGTAFSGEAVIGPILLGPQGYRGFLDALTPILSEDAGSVTWEVYVGDSPEATFALVGNTPRETGTWTAGFGYTTVVGAGGNCCYLRLTGAPWELESIAAQIRQAGRIRLP